ncbi:tRNA (adenosine(37)-N6)-threonylcarbamoyltransferase complex dimerization subunit type 1 TsaB [Desertivirga xinjiangensis]|uniref:tRNA (adenosine(37)-N6)-threonylcarbamoyltransferase complex dimerization subunit type 1 TsaB n=1 Tax=Desertivirga xinjiangensis TaxID=539206 RepID=UPI00210D1606|nr:tRNA (adenosine(37)-N6)-threonylcarbamoyltransferase complex dimerization subunit type 1 TsaB [Pedobacter xinjiangensis]
MALILQIETSTSSCSIALSENGTTLFVKEQNERNIHASHITLFIEEVLTLAGKKPADLNAVAVSMGPGSYTGLRIGVSTAKGLCYALDIPLIAVNTLKAMASGMLKKSPDQDVLLCPMIDARRMEVYMAVYDSALNELTPVEAKIIDADSFRGFQNKKLLLFGDGAEKCRQVLETCQNISLNTGHVNSAGDLSMLAYEKYKNSSFEDVAYFEPYYLKDFLVTQPKASVS